MPSRTGGCGGHQRYGERAHGGQYGQRAVENKGKKRKRGKRRREKNTSEHVQGRRQPSFPGLGFSRPQGVGWGSRGSDEQGARGRVGGSAFGGTGGSRSKQPLPGAVPAPMYTATALLTLVLGCPLLKPRLLRFRPPCQGKVHRGGPGVWCGASGVRQVVWWRRLWLW